MVKELMMVAAIGVDVVVGVWICILPRYDPVDGKNCIPIFRVNTPLQSDPFDDSCSTRCQLFHQSSLHHHLIARSFLSRFVVPITVQLEL